MLNWLKKKTEIEKLKLRYQKLMKKSFKAALSDTKKSDEFHQEARYIFNRIKDHESNKR
ncbi:MAG: Lacal_2735 family protein [Bacteroidia bacterium]|nr:Lacal_2735 family protein [Bacteroidia bacterium]NNF30324.1 Lacal_2735 family protein [Flavobacteriaceae bacterium]MBT8276400.1 Lacal_2735 family protein [Bacteroidia bacterium]NNJ81755.1 Lacal_2735 family protein [Flavobacteriaceae bacterium]NNK53531.1 Lacal_2735 family protein [Flavobacteriaceae bacterium]